MRWKLLWVVLGAVLLTACSSRPSVAVEPMTYDMGEVVNGDIVEYEATVRNLGAADLVISQISTSCSCTTAELEAEVIPPGGSQRLVIRFDSGAHGPDLNGQVLRQIFLETNDPDNPEVVLEFTANVIPGE